MLRPHARLALATANLWFLKSTPRPCKPPAMFSSAPKMACGWLAKCLLSLSGWLLARIALEECPMNDAVQHPKESQSNAARHLVATFEPCSLRTYTPTQAVLAKSSGVFHWTPEGRR